MILITAMLGASFPVPLRAAPDVPICVDVSPMFVRHTVSAPLASERAPMCGPWASNVSPATGDLRERALLAYEEAVEHIAATRYEDARLQLDLARQGLPRIEDRIAIESARLELLRGQPKRAADFFAEAMESPHEAVRVEARSGYVFSLCRADNAETEYALQDLLWEYPSLPRRAELLFEHAQSLIRQSRYEDAIARYRVIEIQHPGSAFSDRARSELHQLGAAGFRVPDLTTPEEIERAERLVRTGPLREAKAAVAALMARRFSLEEVQYAQTSLLAGRLARFEGRWEAAEAHFREAQGASVSNLRAARRLQDRVNDMAAAASSRDHTIALRRIEELGAGRNTTWVPASRLQEMVRVASAAGLRAEVDEMLTVLERRKSVAPKALFAAAMSAAGTASEERIIDLLTRVLNSGDPRYRAACAYHLGRARERAGHPELARLHYAQAISTSEADGSHYYRIWAELGLRRLDGGGGNWTPEGLSHRSVPPVPTTPHVSTAELGKRLRPLAAFHEKAYPWIGRATDLLDVGEPEAASAELFETYLAWRQARGRPAARAGLDSVARNRDRRKEPISSYARSLRLELSDDDRRVLSEVARALGDLGTAGGFAGPEFLETQPRAYDWLVVPAAHRYGLDPNLLLAVMRVESAFQKHIVSYAGAVGLMQIMPRTGQLIAHALGDEDFTPADLLDPKTNLDFAAWYLASLIRRFDGRLPLAIAAYNGGPHNVRRWMQENPERMPLDVLLERIPFSQTHRYVRRVLIHYEAYRRQQSLELPLLSVDLPTQRVDPLAF